MTQIDDISIARAYLQAKKYLYESGYFEEIEWQYGVNLSRINEKSFLEEYAWVVLNTGMSEKIIRKIFPYICSSFFHWSSVEKIVNHCDLCKNNALKYFNNKRKIDAIIETSKFIYDKKFNVFWKEILNNDIDYLKKLPYIGPITSYHLAKNIGFSVSKPDRHLVKMAKTLCYNSVDDMCNAICFLTDEPINVIDLVLWRYSTLKNDFCDICIHYNNFESIPFLRKTITYTQYDKKPIED
jgi:hypothetical protein